MNVSSGGKPHELRAGAVLSYAVIGVQFLAGMLFTPLQIRLLGQAEFGLYQLSLSIISYLNLMGMGFSGAYMRFYSRFAAKGDAVGIRSLNGLFLALFSCSSALVAVAGSIASSNAGALLGPEFSKSEVDLARILFIILTVNIVITFLTTAFTCHIIAQERFIVQKGIQLLKAMLSPIAMLAALLLGHGSIGMTLSLTVVNALLSAYTVYFAVAILKMRFAGWKTNPGLLKSVTLFSSFIFINMVVDQINWNVDKFIIGRFHGAMPVAIYGVAAIFNTYYLTFSTAISSVFVPRVNTMIAHNSPPATLNLLFARVGRIQFFVLALVLSGIILFGKPFIRIWAGSEYDDAYLIAILLLVPVTIDLVQNLGIEIQKARNMHHFRTWTYLFIAMANVTVTIPVTREFGATGAAAVTSFSLLVSTGLLMNWYYHARMGLDIGHFWSQIARMSIGLLPSIIVALLMHQLLDLYSFPVLMACVGLYTFVYVTAMWKLGLNEWEKALFRGIMRVRSRRKS